MASVLIIWGNSPGWRNKEWIVILNASIKNFGRDKPRNGPPAHQEQYFSGLISAERLILSTGWQACAWLHQQHQFGLKYQRSGLLSHVVFRFGTDIVLTCRSNCSPTTFDCNPFHHDCGARVRRGCYTTTTILHHVLFFFPSLGTRCWILI